MGEQVFKKANEPKFSYFPDNDDHMMDYDENLIETLGNFFKVSYLSFNKRETGK